MGYHLHWLYESPKPGQVRHYIHDHAMAPQSHFYAGDSPVHLKLTGSFPSGPRTLPDGSRNTKTHLRWPDDYGEEFLLCKAVPLSISLSRSGPVTCKHCLRKISSMDTLWTDVQDYRSSVDIVGIERALQHHASMETLRTLSRLERLTLRRLLGDSSSLSPTATTGQGLGW